MSNDLAVQTLAIISGIFCVFGGVWFFFARHCRGDRFFVSLSAFACGSAVALIGWGEAGILREERTSIVWLLLVTSLVCKLCLLSAISRRSAGKAPGPKQAIIPLLLGVLFAVLTCPQSAGNWIEGRNLLFTTFFVASLWLFGLRQLRILKGIHHAEYCYVLFALLLQGLLIIAASMRIGFFPVDFQISLLLCFSTLFPEALVLSLLSARRLESFILQSRSVGARIVVLLALVLFYFACLRAARTLVGDSGESVPWFAPLLASFFVSALLYPVRGYVDRVFHYLFVHPGSLQSPTTVRESMLWLQTIQTVPQAAQRYRELVERLFRARRVFVVMKKEGQFVDAANGVSIEPMIPRLGELASSLDMTKDPLVVDDAFRFPVAVGRREAMQILDEADFAVAIPLAKSDAEEGFVLVGPREGNLFFGRSELEVLEAFTETFSTAVQNFMLYTELLDARVYNSLLLESLGSGVIATDLPGRITLCNKEAARLLSRGSETILGCPVSVLPNFLSQALQQVLETGKALLNGEHEQDLGDGSSMILRYSAAPFDNYSGERLGTVLIINDLTQLRQLQQRASRTDRRASLGTLAAGMAHEIKNPLVSVKTFTELLPLRYSDEEYRQQFSTLVTHELERIEGIVGRLLDFAAPSKAQLEPIHFHDVVSKTGALVAANCEKHGIDFGIELSARRDDILGDAEMLGQVLLNLFLNAVEAMSRGGTLSVRTFLASLAFGADASERESRREVIGLSVRDTGGGILPENLSRIFDPFFTTKGFGTGLGLAISYGIIQEHGGRIDVDSDGKTGTTFTITIPLRAPV